MKDERYHAEALTRTPDEDVHKEIRMLRHMERIGTLVKNGLIDGDVLFDFMGFYIQENWQRLRPLALEQRKLYDIPQLWENFEYLATQADRSIRRR